MRVPGGGWPLVGRDEELAAILDAIDAAEMIGVVVAGEAGVGKTRLAREVLATASARGLATRWVVATQAASTIPLGALAQLLPDLGERTPSQAQLLRSAAAALQEQAGSRRLVVGVDDAHLLDDSSAALLHQLAAAPKVFVLATLRSGEPVPDPILALWKDGLAERLELQALSRREVEQLVCAVLGGRVDGLTLHRLWTATLGNSLLLRELLLAGREHGELGQRGGVWRWTGAIGATSRLGDMVEARLGRLEGAQRAVLELVAAGEPIGPMVVEQSASPGVLEALERRSLIVVEQHGRRFEVRPAHPLYGDVLRRRTPVLRAQAVHGQLADAVEAVGMRRREDLLRVATWRLASARPARPDLLTTAARRASNADDVLAERLARAAVEAGGGIEAGIVLGRALNGQRRYQEAERVLAGLTGLARTEQQLADLAIERADTLRPMHRYAEATAELRATAAAVAARGPRDRLAAALAKSLIFDGDVGRALEMALAVLADEQADEPAFAQAIWIAAWALVLVGRASEAIAVVNLRERLGDRWKNEAPWSHAMIECMGVSASLSLGRFDEAEATAEAGYRDSLRDQWAWGVKFWALELMNVALARGCVRTAVQWGQENLAQVPAAGDATLPHLNLVVPLALAGDLEGAEAAFARAEVVRFQRSRLALLEVEQARRWIEAGQGSLSSAITLALRAADLAESMGANDSCAIALHDAARFGGATQVAGRLRALAKRVDSPVAPLYAAHAAALTAMDGMALDELAISFERVGAMLLAAEASAEATVAHRGAGRDLASRLSAARASMLADRCEGAQTPALRLLQQPPSLTPREREIAGLVAAGLSNRMIAERLVVSVRTVDNHLQHVFDKLGVRNRRELGGLISTSAASDRARSSE
jgi:DNA-binding CsgD family transcriptional regulator